MLVYFQFRRCGYYAHGLIESENLDVAAKALWSEHVKTFKWEPQLNFIPDEMNTLTVEEYKYGASSDGKTEPEAKPGGEMGK